MMKVSPEMLGSRSFVRTRKGNVYQVEIAVGVGRDDEAKLLFVAELVANSPNGQDHLRVFRVLFDLGSQTIDVGIDSAVITFIGVVPDFFEQVLTRENPPRVRCEEPQEVKLFGSKLHLAFSDSYFASRGIDSQPSANDRRFVLGAGRARRASCSP